MMLELFSRQSFAMAAASLDETACMKRSTTARIAVSSTGWSVWPDAAPLETAQKTAAIDRFRASAE